MEPGPTPTFTTSAPASARARAPAAVATLPAITSRLGYCCLMRRTASSTPLLWPWAVSMLMMSTPASTRAATRWRSGGRQGEGVHDDRRLGALDAAHLVGLGLHAHVLMNDAEATFLGQRHGHAGLGHGVHRGRDEGQMQPDAGGELSAGVYVARQHFRVSG
nr:hypothetical protein [Tanacetum cinerariifolium]